MILCLVKHRGRKFGRKKCEKFWDEKLWPCSLICPFLNHYLRTLRMRDTWTENVLDCHAISLRELKCWQDATLNLPLHSSCFRRGHVVNRLKTPILRRRTLCGIWNVNERRAKRIKKHSYVNVRKFKSTTFMGIYVSEKRTIFDLSFLFVFVIPISFPNRSLSKTISNYFERAFANQDRIWDWWKCESQNIYLAMTHESIRQVLILCDLEILAALTIWGTTNHSH